MIQGMDTAQQRRKVFWSAFWCGMASPGLLLAGDVVRIPRVEVRQVSALDAMRGDWENIGDDFRRVISREETAGR